MRYIIGLFGCAGKTEGVLCTETGLVLRRVVRTCPPEKIIEELAEGMPPRETAVFAGMANEADARSLTEKIKTILPDMVRVQCESFAAAFLRANIAHGTDGAVLHMCMTAGAAAQKDGKLYTVGGDCTPSFSPGGIFSVGFSAVSAAFAAASGNGTETCLVRMLEGAIGMPLLETENFLATAENEKIASLARIVRRGARGGDSVCLAIIKETLDAVFGYLETVSVLFSGRVPLYVQDIPAPDRESIKAAINSRFSEKFTVLFSDTPPVLGALRGAAALLGVTPDEKFERYFKETYPIL